MFEKIGVMIDCSRNAVPSVGTLKVLIGMLAAMGYNRLELYTEDTYEIKGRPYFGYLRGRYTGAELKEIDACAAANGIELTPCIQVLAHLGSIFRWTCFGGVQDCNDILLCGEPETYRLIEDMFAAAAESFTSREINIGCDEAHMAGLGKYLDRFGHQDRFGILNRHLGRVLEIAGKYGFKCSMWSDMYFRLASQGGYEAAAEIPPEVLERVPEGLSLIWWHYWRTDPQYYRDMLAAHKRFRNGIEFAGAATRWQGFAPDNIFAARLADAAVPAAREYGIKNVMLTAWGDGGAEASLFSVLPALFYFARLCRGKSVAPADLESGFRKIAGTGFSEFLDIGRISRFPWYDAEKYRGKAGNPEKHLLYNDYFCGIFDGLVRGGEAAHFRETAERLKIGKYGRFSYIFRTMGALSSVLELKAEIGVRTRAAYRNGDRAGAKKLADEYGEIARRIAAFHKLFRAQWMRENKPHGFEIQDMRLGGLIRRTLSCRQALLDWQAGKADAVLELDEEILPFDGAAGELCIFNDHLRNISVNTA
jgi:hypothetical protein